MLVQAALVSTLYCVFGTPGSTSCGDLPLSGAACASGRRQSREDDEAFDLAVPVIVSGDMRTVLRASDFFMDSLALGGSAVAGLELGFQYYFIEFGLALGLSSGTISLVSRFVGVGELENANFYQAIFLDRTHDFRAAHAHHAGFR